MLPAALSFQSVVAPSCARHPIGAITSSSKTRSFLVDEKDEAIITDDGCFETKRRSFVSSAGVSFMTILAAQAVAPQSAHAGIDLSGVRTDGGSGSSIGGSTLQDQLRAYDGSGTSRVEQIKAASSASPQSTAASVPLGSVPVAVDPTVATYALRSSFSIPKLTKVGIAGLLNRLEDQVLAPKGSKSGTVFCSFEFPSDWLQLDKVNGGIQYVDQRNGDKLYLLRASLPTDTTLATVPKKFFGDSIFDVQGSVVRGGNPVEDYKVSSSVLGSQVVACPTGACSITRRRMTVKYATVTGNGLRVERRALVDAYEVGSDVYMLVTSSNAVKFEAKGKERDTVEAIVDSFRVEA
jgi:hypothetical protein